MCEATRCHCTKTGLGDPGRGPSSPIALARHSRGTGPAQRERGGRPRPPPQPREQPATLTETSARLPANQGVRFRFQREPRTLRFLRASSRPALARIPEGHTSSRRKLRRPRLRIKHDATLQADSSENITARVARAHTFSPGSRGGEQIRLCAMPKAYAYSSGSPMRETPRCNKNGMPRLTREKSAVASTTQQLL